jgi:hypothetical protein
MKEKSISEMNFDYIFIADFYLQLNTSIYIRKYHLCEEKKLIVISKVHQKYLFLMNLI